MIETERLILRRCTKENLEWRIGTDEMIAAQLKDSHKMIGNVYMGKCEFETLEILNDVSYWTDGGWPCQI